ncbi:MAG: hypothetical protein ACTSQ4_02340 [Candidatus Heimdallarchaeaceae archaeon]
MNGTEYALTVIIFAIMIGIVSWGLTQLLKKIWFTPQPVEVEESAEQIVNDN